MPLQRHLPGHRSGVSTAWSYRVCERKLHRQIIPQFCSVPRSAVTPISILLRAGLGWRNVKTRTAICITVSTPIRTRPTVKTRRKSCSSQVKLLYNCLIPRSNIIRYLEILMANHLSRHYYRNSLCPNHHRGGPNLDRRILNFHHVGLAN